MLMTKMGRGRVWNGIPQAPLIDEVSIQCPAKILFLSYVLKIMFAVAIEAFAMVSSGQSLSHNDRCSVASLVFCGTAGLRFQFFGSWFGIP